MKTAIRTSKIEIDTAVLHGPQWINATLQTLELDADNNVTSTRVRDRKLYRKVDLVATETVTITDPVTQQQVTISVAGIGVAIKAKMIGWMMEDNASTYNEDADLVVLNGPSQ
jgi:hypothetical protein